jgi:hypothetical protein
MQHPKNNHFHEILYFTQLDIMSTLDVIKIQEVLGRTNAPIFLAFFNNAMSVALFNYFELCTSVCIVP